MGRCGHCSIALRAIDVPGGKLRYALPGLRRARGVAHLRGLRGVVADRAQVTRVDQDLRDRGVFVRREDDEHTTSFC
jgi:hypothetical protein